MVNLNKVIIVGNLTKDPELKQVSTGKVCNLNLAIRRSVKNNHTGKETQEVSYVDVAVWGDRGVSCHENLKKGRSVLIEGRLKSESWTDQTGQSRSRHLVVAENVVFIGQETEITQQHTAASTEMVQRPEASSSTNVHEELPF